MASSTLFAVYIFYWQDYKDICKILKATLTFSRMLNLNLLRIVAIRCLRDCTLKGSEQNGKRHLHYEENQFWESGVISLENPAGLLCAVFFYNGKNFCLRGGKEQ